MTIMSENIDDLGCVTKMAKVYCNYAESVYDDDYSECNIDENNKLTQLPKQKIVALYCHKINDYCSGYNLERCD